MKEKGLEPILCETEDEARQRINELDLNNQWPCLFTKSDITGEKDFEEFFTDKEKLDLDRFRKIGIIKNNLIFDNHKIEFFEAVISRLKDKNKWNKEQIVNLFYKLIPDFDHKEIGRYLDSKM